MAEADRYNAWLLVRARPFLGSKMLEIGAGIGTFTEGLAERSKVVAVEPDPALAAHLRRNAPSAEVFEGEAGDAPAGHSTRSSASTCSSTSPTTAPGWSPSASGYAPAATCSCSSPRTRSCTARSTERSITSGA